MKFHPIILRIAFLGLLIISGASCDKENNVSHVPEITHLEFIKPARELVIEFRDGDGNFGIDSDSPPFEDTITNPYRENLWIDYFELRSGSWVEVEPKSSLGFRVRPLDPDGQSDLLEVKFTRAFDDSELPLPSHQSDTVKLRVIIVDRDLNESQPVETDTLVFDD